MFSSLVITVKCNWEPRFDIKLTKQVHYSLYFTHYHRHIFIFYFDRGSTNRALFFWCPWNEWGIKKYTKSYDWLFGDRARRSTNRALVFCFSWNKWGTKKYTKSDDYLFGDRARRPVRITKSLSLRSLFKGKKKLFEG